MEHLKDTFQVHDFFGGDIPSAWNEAQCQLSEAGKTCTKELFLTALMEQENP